MLLEGREQVGAKYCYTGMGAAPVSNVGIDVSRFCGSDARYVSDALKAFPLAALRDWFAQEEVALEDAEYYGLVQPVDGGPEVISKMLDALTLAGGELLTSAEVISVESGFQCATADGRNFHARALVLATGGANLPQFGEPRPELPTSLGHTSARDLPSLVPITVEETWPGALAGLWMDVHLRLLSGKRVLRESTGSMLFTSGALTGEAVFNISAEVTGHEGLELSVNFHPGMEPDDVAEWLRRVLGERTRERVEGAIDYIVPQRLGEVFLRRQKIKPGTRVMQLTERQREGLLHDMLDTRLQVTGTLGMRAAEGVTGGVNVREVDPRSLESKRTPGLYIIGRALDVSADWGGIEQHFALASGLLAGHSLLQ